jgi:hypothetical protein
MNELQQQLQKQVEGLQSLKENACEQERDITKLMEEHHRLRDHVDELNLKFKVKNCENLKT